MTSNTDRMVVLNRLLNLERFSLAKYLQYARPLVRPGDEALRDAVGRIACDQLECARRVADLTTRRKAGVQPGQGFPAKYTAYNDLEIRPLLDRLIEDQERIVREVGACLAALGGDHEAECLTAEVLGSEQTHVNTLLDFRDRGPARGTGFARAP